MNNAQLPSGTHHHHHVALIVVTLALALVGLGMARVYHTNVWAGILIGALIGIVFVADLTRHARDI